MVTFVYYLLLLVYFVIYFQVLGLHTIMLNTVIFQETNFYLSWKFEP